MLAYGVATVALAATLVVAVDLELDALDTPPGQCGTMAVKWRGGKPPYQISITKVQYPNGSVDTNTRNLTGPGGDPNQAPDKAFSTFEWVVNYPPRAMLSILVADGANGHSPIPPFYVAPGTDACMTTASSSPSTLPSPTAGTTESSSPLASNSPSGSNSDPPNASESSDADAAGSGASNSSSHKSKSNTGAIAGGVVGGIAAILAVLLALFLCRRRRNRRRPSLSRAPSGGPVGTLAPPPKDDDHDTVTPDSTASKRMTFLSYNGNDSSVGHGSSIGPDDEMHSSFGHVSAATTVLAGMTDSSSLSPPPSHARYSNHTPQSSPRNSTIPPSPLSDAGAGAAAPATVPATPIAASARSPRSTANVTSWAGSQAGHTSPPNSPRSGQTVWGSPKSQQSPWGSNTDSLMVDDAYGSDDDVPKGRSLPPPPRPVRL